jgi:hypothetical protein
MEQTIESINVLKPHISLNVKSVATSVEFYKKMFGVEPSKLRSGYAKFDLNAPSLNLSLNESRKDLPEGRLSHLGIQVASTEDVRKFKSLWTNTELATVDENNTSCCYALQDKTWVTDPDGNSWEAFVVLQDNLPEQAEAQGCAGSCSCG